MTPQHGPETTETMRQLRVALRQAMRTTTIEQAAGLAGCSVKTVWRILHERGNTRIVTAARLVERLGGRLEIRLADADQQNTPQRIRRRRVSLPA